MVIPRLLIVNAAKLYISSLRPKLFQPSLSLAMYLSADYMRQNLPEKTGKTFSQFQLEARMRRAKLLLEHTDLSIVKIAAILGYSNKSNFYKAFREYYGTSPRLL